MAGITTKTAAEMKAGEVVYVAELLPQEEEQSAIAKASKAFGMLNAENIDMYARFLVSETASEHDKILALYSVAKKMGEFSKKMTDLLKDDMDFIFATALEQGRKKDYEHCLGINYTISESNTYTFEEDEKWRKLQEEFEKKANALDVAKKKRSDREDEIKKAIKKGQPTEVTLTKSYKQFSAKVS